MNMSLAFATAVCPDALRSAPVAQVSARRKAGRSTATTHAGLALVRTATLFDLVRRGAAAAARNTGSGGPSSRSQRRRPRASASGPPVLGRGGPQEGDTRVLPVVTAPMTGGADVLFPGGSQHAVFAGDSCVEVLRDVATADPPEFGFIPVDAWGAACQVGTLAVVEDLELCVDDPEVAVVCTGVARFRVLDLAEDKTSATVAIFHDDPVSDHDLDAVHTLEDSILSSVKDIVRLSIKTAGAEDAPKRLALLETMKRMDAFALGSDDHVHEDLESSDLRVLKHWMVGMDSARRRELLSFIILDLLSMSFMDRREILMSTDTMERMQHAHQALQPYLKELAAKGAIVSALGASTGEDDFRSASAD